MEPWWCLDCRTRVELNRHGRCQCCGSEAVDSMERTSMYTTTSSVFTPVNEFAERVAVHTVHMQATLRWESDARFPSLAEAVLSY